MTSARLRHRGDGRTVWTLLSWVTLGAILLAAALNMAQVSAGFATSHLADVAVPAWMYIMVRGLAEPGRVTRVRRLFGASPERAAIVLFAASTATEVAQLFWPSGLSPGTFDPLDIAAFAFGIAPLYALDKWSQAAQRSRQEAAADIER